MDLLKKYLIPLYDAETGGAAGAGDPPAPPAPLVAAAGDPPAPVADAAAIDPAVAGDPPEASAVEPALPGVLQPAADSKKVPKWMRERLSEETQAKHAERTRAEAAERRAQEAEELARRLQADGNQSPAAPAQQPPVPDFNEAVRTEAARQRFVDDTIVVRDAGLATIPNFNETLGLLNTIGATSDDFVADVLAVDKANAHFLFDKLAQDPEKASSLVKMNSRTRIAELTRMSMTQPAATALTPIPAAAGRQPAAPAARQVSRAPAPAPAVDPSASKVTDWRSDEASDAEFSKGFDDNRKQRTSRR